MRKKWYIKPNKRLYQQQYDDYIKNWWKLTYKIFSNRFTASINYVNKKEKQRIERLQNNMKKYNNEDIAIVIIVILFFWVLVMYNH